MSKDVMFHSESEPKKELEEYMSNAASHSPFEMVLHLECSQVIALGPLLNGLLAAQSVGLTVVFCVLLVC